MGAGGAGGLGRAEGGDRWGREPGWLRSLRSAPRTAPGPSAWTSSLPPRLGRLGLRERQLPGEGPRVLSHGAVSWGPGVSQTWHVLCSEGVGSAGQLQPEAGGWGRGGTERAVRPGNMHLTPWD